MSIPSAPLSSPVLERNRPLADRVWADWFTQIVDHVEDTPHTHTGDFTAGKEHRLLVDASLSDVTISLPAMSTLTTKGYSITKIDSTTNVVIVDPYGAETILGDSTLIIANQYDTADMFPASEGWFLE